MSVPPLLVTTPTGNTGRHVLAEVLAAGRPVRVLVRDPARLPPVADGKCEVVVGDLHDPAALGRALSGVESAFFCVPQSPNPDDVAAHFRGFAEPFAAAAQGSGLRRVVTVSGGDGRPGEDGPGAALQLMERTIDRAGVAARHVRCGYFMENLLYQTEALAHGGVFALPLAPDVPLAFVATRDIGRAAGRLLLDPDWAGTAAVEAYGPTKVSCGAAAEILSVALGRPVRYVHQPAAAWAEELVGYGVSRAMAAALVEMFAAIAAGHDMGRPPAAPVACPTTLAEWARTDLAPAVAGVLGRTG